MLHSGAAAAADGGLHACPAVVFGEAVSGASALQRGDHFGLVEFATGDELKKTEAGAVEGVVS